MYTLLLASSPSWLEPCALLSPALERHLGFQERSVGLHPLCIHALKAVTLHVLARVVDRFKCLIKKNINITALGSIQNNECMLVVCLVTSGLIWPRNGVIILRFPQVDSLSRLFVPTLAWRTGTIVPTRTGERPGEAWIPQVSPVASTSRHLSEVPKWQALSSPAACARKRGKLLLRYGGAHLFWLTVET